MKDSTSPFIVHTLLTIMFFSTLVWEWSAILALFWLRLELVCFITGSLGQWTSGEPSTFVPLPNVRKSQLCNN